MKPSTPHRCPHCRCEWVTRDDCGTINRDAEYFPLVELIDSLEHVDPRERWKVVVA